MLSKKDTALTIKRGNALVYHVSPFLHINHTASLTPRGNMCQVGGGQGQPHLLVVTSLNNIEIVVESACLVHAPRVA